MTNIETKQSLTLIDKPNVLLLIAYVHPWHLGTSRKQSESKESMRKSKKTSSRSSHINV